MHKLRARAISKESRNACYFLEKTEAILHASMAGESDQQGELERLLFPRGATVAARGGGHACVPLGVGGGSVSCAAAFACPFPGSSSRGACAASACPRGAPSHRGRRLSLRAHSTPTQGQWRLPLGMLAETARERGGVPLVPRSLHGRAQHAVPGAIGLTRSGSQPEPRRETNEAYRLVLRRTAPSPLDVVVHLAILR